MQDHEASTLRENLDQCNTCGWLDSVALVGRIGLRSNMRNAIMLELPGGKMEDVVIDCHDGVLTVDRLANAPKTLVPRGAPRTSSTAEADWPSGRSAPRAVEGAI
jgi:hypothetical protein